MLPLKFEVNLFFVDVHKATFFSSINNLSHTECGRQFLTHDAGCGC